MSYHCFMYLWKTKLVLCPYVIQKETGITINMYVTTEYTIMQRMGKDSNGKSCFELYNKQ